METYIRFGWLRFTRAGKDYRCARGKHCTNGDFVIKGLWHASVALGRYKSDDRKGLSIVRHLHLKCLTDWAEYQCSILDSITPKRGRPKGSLADLLTPEEKTERRKLTDRRKYLVRKIKYTDNPELALSSILEISDISGTLGKEGNYQSQVLGRKVAALRCDIGPDYCQLDENRHCIHCNRCFAASDGCFRRVFSWHTPYVQDSARA